MDNLLNTIDIIYERKKNIWKLIREKPKDKSFQDKDNVYGKGWFIIENPSDGNCFFDSVIQSNIELIYNNINLRTILNYDENRDQFVVYLRNICIDTIKYGNQDISIVNAANNTNYTKLTEWYSDMHKTEYWADDFMINAFIKTFKIIPVLIQSNDSAIYCPIIQLEEFLDNIEDILRKSNYRFIVMWYQKGVHFEIMKTNDDEGHLVEYFDNFVHLERICPDLANHIIKDCRFKKLST